jgi:2-methylcitrate dehydratase PrpD
MSDLVNKYGLKTHEIERIEVGVTESTLMHGASIVEPKDTISASFSLAFSLAICVIKKSNDLSLYMDEKVRNDSEVLKLAHKVHPYAVPEEAKDTRFASKIKVTLTGGKTEEGYEATQAERYEKFRRLSSSVLSAKRMDEVIHTVENVEQLKDISSLVSLLVRE